MMGTEERGAITNQCDDGPSASSDLGLASESSLQLAFDHLPLPLSVLGNAGELS